MAQITTRRFLKVATALVAGVVLAACGKQEPAPSAASAAASAPPAPVVKTYTVGTDAAYAPFEFQNEKGEIVGFSMELLTAVAKKAGRPWELAKAFEHSAPVGALVPASRIGHPHKAAIWLKVNGETRQSGDLDQMIWKVPEIIAELSKLFTLAPGDVICTGTPAGVSPVVKGDRVECGIDGIGTLSVTVV